MSSRFHKNRDREPGGGDLLPSERAGRRPRPSDEEGGGSRWAGAAGADSPAPTRGKGCFVFLALLFFPLMVALGIALQTGSWKGADPYVVHLEQGRTLSYAGKLDEAMAEFEAAKALRPADAEAYFEIATIHMERKDMGQCEAVTRQGLAVAPNDATLHLSLGLVYADRDDDRAAVAEYRRAIAASFDYPTAHYDLGLAYARLGENQLAIEELEIAIRLEPAGEFASRARKILEQLRR